MVEWITRSTYSGGVESSNDRGLASPAKQASIPCAHGLYVTPGSSPCPWIEPDRRGLADTLAADENTRLRAWTKRFRPSPPPSRTSL